MKRPVVLVLAGHDPTGGAGVQADIEAIAAQTCHAVSVLTCITVQDTRNVKQISLLDPQELKKQLQCLLADIEIAAIKIGLIPDLALIPMISDLLIGYRSLPCVLDPVLAAGGGAELSDQALIQAIREHILPFVTLVTPNVLELQRLSGLPRASELEQVESLLATGCQAVLVTGTHKPTQQVIQQLYLDNQPRLTWEWERLPYDYHGSGCTLASACAGQLAQGLDLEAALTKAQSYTWQALKQADSLGQGQWLPHRWI